MPLHRNNNGRDGQSIELQSLDELKLVVREFGTETRDEAKALVSVIRECESKSTNLEKVEFLAEVLISDITDRAKEQNPALGSLSKVEIRSAFKLREEFKAYIREKDSKYSDVRPTDRVYEIITAFLEQPFSNVAPLAESLSKLFENKVHRDAILKMVLQAKEDVVLERKILEFDRDCYKKQVESLEKRVQELEDEM